MLYAGQQILRGQAPYVGVTIVKLPVSPFVAAAGIAVGRAFGIDDIVAGRLAFWLCASVSVGAVFVLGATLLKPARSAMIASRETSQVLSALAGSLAAAFLLSFQTFGIQVAEGPEAKFPMVCAGMLCLVLLAREQFFWAGIASALSFMAWQPGLIFILATTLAAIFFSATRQRALRDALLGIAIPILLLGVYLAFQGALASMFRQTFGANANYLGDKKVATGILSVLAENVLKVWNVSLECSWTETPFVLLGELGMVAGILFFAVRFWKTRDAKFFLGAFPLVVSGAALFGFSLLDIQKCSDLVPLLPYLALGATFPLISLISLFAKKDVRAAFALGGLVLVVVLLYGTRDAFTSPRQNGLPQQRALAHEIAARLQASDRVQQFGDTVLLVVTQRENATRFVHLGEKQGIGILNAEGITLNALVAQLQQANPRVITLSRAKDKIWAAPLYAWIEKNYTLQSSYGASEGGTQRETDVWWRNQ